MSPPAPASGASQLNTDRAVVAAQLGREPRALRGIAARCPGGHPAVIQTNPRLADGTPFPTLYYLTCPRLTALVSRLEASGLMREMTERLAAEPELAAAYLAAHRAYLAERDAIEPLGTDVSAGGMPGRVKCLHVHVAHALAAGRGVNPFGDQALDLLRDEWPAGSCAGDQSADESRTKGQL
ncbi:MAG TPA: DUF501 domain-containing protein [Actinophytocola sp.]|uniref:DUF501 domain-containing protein n=1 Tax=Actinophytocola sp. TaxID=1872138 RepID=UPI002E0A85C5|nr:DUF501 domain-containing protein [Actinophytocola sp.]